MNMIHEELAGLHLKKMDAGQVCSGHASGTFVNGYASPSSYTTKIDPDYIFHEASRDLIVWFLNPTDPLCIPENGGELILPHPNFRFSATANTNGGGDDTGFYQGTQRQNLAFADRFMLCKIGYPDQDT